VFKTTRGIAPDYAKNAQDFLATFGDSLKGFSSGAVGAVSNLFGGVLAFVLTLVISFYLSVQKDGVQEFLRFVLPKSHEDYTLRLWHRVDIKLGKWLQGQLLLGVIVGTVVFIGLWFIGVPYALLLGLVAGVFEIIPIVGPLFSSVVGITVATIISPALGVFTAIFYLIVQQSESHILVPLLMKKVTGLNPVVVIIALLVGAKLGGVIGMLISVPLATVAGELFDDFAKQKSLS
jgi:predicted PurR-regulated permease PerM